ncbi:MAG TPA: hypothetical protein VKA67_01965 [Verrucomicrobiae bacterium]|nr:hypothetical protein [Verrucomicrobiae bacterium]
MSEADKAIDQITQDMPEPQDHAIQAEQARLEAQEKATAAPAAPASKASPVDRDGARFHPDLHEADESGKPIVNKDGTLKKRRGRHGAKKDAARSQLNRPSQIEQMGADAAEAGRHMANAIFMFGRVVGGEEWEPMVVPEYGIDEQKQMGDAWSQYFSAKGVNDIPPGIAVTIVTGSYIAARLNKPITKTRLQKVKGWCFEKYGAWRGRKTAQKQKPNGRSDEKKSA